MAGHANLDLAAPFLLSAAIAFVAALLSLWIVEHIAAEYRAILDEQQVSEEQRGTALQPRNLADMSSWLLDAGGMFASLSSPILGFFLLEKHINASSFDVISALVVLLTVAGFAFFVSSVKPRGYANRPLGPRIRGRSRGLRARGPFTPVTMLVILVNLVAGVVLLLFGATA